MNVRRMKALDKKVENTSKTNAWHHKMSDQEQRRLAEEQRRSAEEQRHMAEEQRRSAVKVEQGKRRLL